MKRLLLGVAVGYALVMMAIRWMAEPREGTVGERELPTIH